MGHHSASADDPALPPARPSAMRSAEHGNVSHASGGRQRRCKWKRGAEREPSSRLPRSRRVFMNCCSCPAIPQFSCSAVLCACAGKKSCHGWCMQCKGPQFPYMRMRIPMRAAGVPPDHVVSGKLRRKHVYGVATLSRSTSNLGSRCFHTSRSCGWSGHGTSAKAFAVTE